MSEHFTHVAVFEDSARLFLNSPEICEPFKFSIKNQYDSGLLGSGSRGNHLFAVPILEELKENWEQVKDQPVAQIKMAYAIGWITHRGSDRQMKPVLRKNDDHPDPRFEAQINSVYHDANSFEQVYDSGKIPSLSKNQVISPATFDYNMQSHPAANAVQVQYAEPLFSWMWQKDMMRMHTFSENTSDFDTWLDTLVDRWPKLSENFTNYEKAHMDPDPILEEKYYNQDNLYNPNDDIIVFVRQVQRGNNPGTNIPAIVEKAQNQSQYAQALAKSYLFVKALSDFFTGKIDKTTTYDRVNISQKFRY